MNKRFEINRIRHLSKRKNGRKITERVIPCLFCPTLMECEHKKLKTGNSWKQWVPLKQYCNVKDCGKKAINFRANLMKRLKNPKSESEYLTAQYCLWKMLQRTPIQYLTPILIGSFEHARPKNPCRMILNLPMSFYLKQERKNSMKKDLEAIQILVN